MEVSMRSKTLSILILVMCGALLLTACGAPALAQGETLSQPTLSVYGSGKAYLTPDLATINIGVHTEGDQASETVALNNGQSEQVVQALRDAGIAANDIQTSNFSIYNNQKFDPSGQVSGTSYVVDNSVFVTVRDISTISDTLSAVVEAGANSINSIQFDVSDKSAGLEEAREAAIADAQAQAEQIAESTGFELGEIQSIVVSTGVSAGPFFPGVGGGAAAEAAVPIAPGQMVVSAEANLVYTI
jgi:uncharacterized protein YggE